MIRYCVCGVPIPVDQPFCVTCKEIYGTKNTEWPEWLRVWMANYKRELDQENLHRHYSTEAIIGDPNISQENISNMGEFYKPKLRHKTR